VACEDLATAPTTVALNLRKLHLAAIVDTFAGGAAVSRAVIVVVITVVIVVLIFVIVIFVVVILIIVVFLRAIVAHIIVIVSAAKVALLLLAYLVKLIEVQTAQQELQIGRIMLGQFVLEFDKLIEELSVDVLYTLD